MDKVRLIANKRDLDEVLCRQLDILLADWERLQFKFKGLSGAVRDCSLNDSKLGQNALNLKAIPRQGCRG